MGADSPKSALETEDHVPRAEHIDPIKSCLIRDDLHMTAHLHSKGHFLTPALKENRRTGAQRLLQRHADNRHENILFTDEKIFVIEEHYNNQYNKIYAKGPLRCVLRVQEAITLPTSWFGGGVFHQGVTPHFCEKGVKTGARVY